MSRWRYACPYGHRSVTLQVNRFQCEACGRAGRGYSYPKTDLYDLQAGEEPPHASRL